MTEHGGKHVDIEALRVFLEICRSRSIRKAAESLGVSQPTLTKKIQKLEHAFGAQLLNRLPRGVEPTAYGTVLERHAKFALGEIANAREIIQGVHAGRLGSVGIGMSITTAHILMPAVVNRVRARHPDAEIRLTENTVQKLSDDLLAGDLDLVVAPLPRAGPDRDLHVRPLLQDELIVVASEQHPAASKPELRLRDLVEYPWALLGENPHKESLIVPLLLNKGLPMPKWAVRTNSLGFFLRVIRDSDCLALISKRMALHQNEQGIKPLRVTDLSVPWPIMLSYRRNIVVTPLLQTIIDELEKES